jgi:uncharacterized protein (DUF2384 family)
MSRTTALSTLLEHLMSSLGMSIGELASAVGASERTALRWLADERYPQHESRQRLDALERLVERLDETFTAREAGAAWLHTPSGYFGGLRPLDALVCGRIDAVDAALEALDAGIFV